MTRPLFDVGTISFQGTVAGTTLVGGVVAGDAEETPVNFCVDADGHTQVDVITLPAAKIAGMTTLPAGTNNIGDVDVLTLPADVLAGMAALPAGTNNIGDVDVLTLPADVIAGMATLPAGTNNIGIVDIGKPAVFADIALVASAEYTATQTSEDKAGLGCRGVVVVVDVTAVAAEASPSVVVAIQGKVGSSYYNILESAAITGIGTTVLSVYPTLTAAANTKVNDVLPNVWRVTATHADADGITYSISAAPIV